MCASPACLYIRPGNDCHQDLGRVLFSMLCVDSLCAFLSDHGSSVEVHDFDGKGLM